jgi:hypothetical protein
MNVNQRVHHGLLNLMMKYQQMMLTLQVLLVLLLWLPFPAAYCLFSIEVNVDKSWWLEE